MIVAAGFGTGQVLWSVLWLGLFVLVAWLFVTLFADIMRSDDLTGWGKALWTLGLLIVPLLGGLVYLTVRGGSMNRRLVEHGLRSPIDPVGGSPENERARLSTLHDAGAITDDEFRRAIDRLPSSPHTDSPREPT